MNSNQMISFGSDGHARNYGTLRLLQQSCHATLKTPAASAGDDRFRAAFVSHCTAFSSSTAHTFSL